MPSRNWGALLGAILISLLTAGAFKFWRPLVTSAPNLTEASAATVTSDTIRPVGAKVQPSKPAAHLQEGTAKRPIRTTFREPERMSMAAGSVPSAQGPQTAVEQPAELALTRAGSVVFDLRSLPAMPPPHLDRPERDEPEPRPVAIARDPNVPVPPTPPSIPAVNAPAPAPIMSFEGLDKVGWGSGWPPDTNGDVGPTYYVQAINTSIGVFRKSDGERVAAFSLNTFMSQGHFGNLCDTDNRGDPVVLYDTFEDRWIITDFAILTDQSNNIINPPGAFQCIAASKTGDPVSGGWNFYSINTAGGIGDYPKFGIWPDGLYMSAKMFTYSNVFIRPRVYAFNKAQMYAGEATAQVVTFDAPTNDSTILPSNARLQAGTPPAGRPNFYVSTGLYTNAIAIYKFHVDWNRPTLSTFTGPDAPQAPSQYPNQTLDFAPELGGTNLDTLGIRAMAQNQYANLGGAESLWVSHTVRRGNAGTFTGFAAPRWYQANVTGGTVAASLLQGATWDPDGANVMHRFMVSSTVDRAGNFAMGYTTSSSSTKPAIKYAGRLSGDPVNTLGQTETVLMQGAGAQVGVSRWGDYSSMTLDPDGCTFWYTNQYYPADGLNYQTRIFSFTFPSCTPIAAGGTLSGTVRSSAAGNPVLAGVTMSLGSRTTTTNASGVYTFAGVPAGTYPSLNAAIGGYTVQTAATLVVAQSATTTRDFTLTPFPSGCFVDTSQADFQNGVPTNCDLTSTPGALSLTATTNGINQQANASGFTTPITTTTWGGQTFTPSVSGVLTRADTEITYTNGFCSPGYATFSISLRATSDGLPTGEDLATATMTGNPNSSPAYTGTFSSPPAITAGTMYALVITPTSVADSRCTFGLWRSGSSAAGSSIYAGGTYVQGASSGTSWSIPTFGGTAFDTTFKAYVRGGFASSGNLVSTAKDANPAAGYGATWTAITASAAVPSGSTLQFQAAGSNSPYGPFDFVGPDGTAATYFASGASFARFRGYRYFQYKAFMTSATGAAAPTVNDITVCFMPYALFTDDLLVAGITPLRAVHIEELRTRINALRQRFGLPAFSFTDPSLTAGGTPIKAIHITELRTALVQAYGPSGFAAPTFTDSVLSIGATGIKRVHIHELRDAVVSLEVR